MKTRIPSLDGLRAIAIIGVTLSHVFGGPFLALGPAGVNLFFVLSGFLITRLLIAERETTGRISLPGFFFRRTRRIIPAYAVSIAVAAAVSLSGHLSVSRAAWIQALTYTYSLAAHHAHEGIQHVWSLSVEEHFYLIWPVLLALIGFRKAPRILAFAVVLAVPLRFVLIRSTAEDIDFFTFTRIDVIAIGCLLAFASRAQRAREIARGPAALPIGLIAWVVGRFILSSSGKFTIGLLPAWEAIAFACILLATVERQRGFAFHALNHPAVRYIGRLSYSIYLAQFFSIAFPDRHEIALVMIGAYAVLSHHLIELPVMRIQPPQLLRRGFSAAMLVIERGHA